MTGLWVPHPRRDRVVGAAVATSRSSRRSSSTDSAPSWATRRPRLRSAGLAAWAGSARRFVSGRSRAHTSPARQAATEPSASSRPHTDTPQQASRGLTHQKSNKPRTRAETHKIGPQRPDFMDIGQHPHRLLAKTPWWDVGQSRLPRSDGTNSSPDLDLHMILGESPHWPRRGKTPGQSVARRSVVEQEVHKDALRRPFRGEFVAKWPFSGDLSALAATRVMSSLRAAVPAIRPTRITRTRPHANRQSASPASPRSSGVRPATSHSFGNNVVPTVMLDVRWRRQLGSPAEIARPGVGASYDSYADHRREPRVRTAGKFRSRPSDLVADDSRWRTLGRDVQYRQ